MGPPTASYKSVYDTYEILVRCILHKPNSAPSYVLQLCHKSALNPMKSPFLVLKSTFSYGFRGPTWCFVKQSRGLQLPVFLPILAGEIPHPASCLTIIGLGYPADRFACKVRLILTSLSEAKFGEAAKKNGEIPKEAALLSAISEADGSGELGRNCNGFSAFVVLTIQMCDWNLIM